VSTYRIDPVDRDPRETQEWIESLEAVVEASDPNVRAISCGGC